VNQDINKLNKLKKSKLSQTNPRDTLKHVHRVVNTCGRWV